MIADADPRFGWGRREVDGRALVAHAELCKRADLDDLAVSCATSDECLPRRESDLHELETTLHLHVFFRDLHYERDMLV